MRKSNILRPMRIVSLVPSWTEALLEAQLNVVGRTRFCIHPEAALKIPVIGGTKDWEWEKIKALKPDLLVLDQEENPKFMSEQSEIPWVATHVTSMQNLPDQLRILGMALGTPVLDSFSERWQRVLRVEAPKRPWEHLPGVREWVTPISGPIDRVLYVIWREPWMVVSRNTFIGSMLSLFGPERDIYQGREKYPNVLKEEMDKPGTLLLFSSEPFPFHRQKSLIREFSAASAIVDGESFSWFGLRSLLFLEKHLGVN